MRSALFAVMLLAVSASAAAGPHYPPPRPQLPPATPFCGPTFCKAPDYFGYRICRTYHKLHGITPLICYCGHPCP